MAHSLLNIVNKWIEEIHKIKCKYRHNNKKCECAWQKYDYHSENDYHLVLCIYCLLFSQHKEVFNELQN